MSEVHGTPTVSYGLDPLVVDSSIWAFEINRTVIEPPPPSLGGEPDPEEEDNQPSPDSEGEIDPDFEGDEEGEDDSTPEGDESEGEEEGDFEGEDEGEGDDCAEGESVEPDGETEGVEEAEEGPTWSLAPAPVSPKELPGLRYLPNHPDLILREFHDFWSFVECATDESLYAWEGRGSRSTHSSHWPDHGEAWHGTETWEEAVEMALGKGWPEGRELLHDSIIAVSPRPIPYESLEFSVAGAFPAVPNYCAGDPECMVIDPGSTLRNPKPVVTIDYNHWIHAGVTTESMMLRGAAVISLANTLEQRGISTVLRIVGATRESKTWAYTIVFKRAGEFLDLDRAAFAIAHPACMRRLAFALLEQHAGLKSQMQGGYGMPTYSNPIPGSDSIYIPGASGRETPDSARAAVREAAEAVLGKTYLEAAD